MFANVYKCLQMFTNVYKCWKKLTNLEIFANFWQLLRNFVKNNFCKFSNNVPILLWKTMRLVLANLSSWWVSSEWLANQKRLRNVSKPLLTVLEPSWNQSLPSSPTLTLTTDQSESSIFKYNLSDTRLRFDSWGSSILCWWFNWRKSKL